MRIVRERRRRRSENTTLALHYQLDSGRKAARLDGLVLSDEDGFCLASSGDPRGWDDDGELTPLRRMAEAFGGRGLQGLDGTAWYHPLRLTLDAGAVAAGNANSAQEVLDVNATHGDDLPRSLKIYAFAAALGGTRVLDAAKTLAKQSRLPANRLTLVDRHNTYAHNDPATAEPSTNEFLDKLVPFLKALD